MEIQLEDLGENVSINEEQDDHEYCESCFISGKYLARHGQKLWRIEVGDGSIRLCDNAIANLKEKLNAT